MTRVLARLRRPLPGLGAAKRALTTFRAAEWRAPEGALRLAEDDGLALLPEIARRPAPPRGRLPD